MTEKNYNPQQKEKKSMKKQEAVAKRKKTEQIAETPKKAEEIVKEKTEEKKPETQKQRTPVKKEIPKVKKTEVSVKGINVPISTKDAKFICKFIKNKKIRDAIKDLEQVKIRKKAVPMLGEIPHRKGKGISSGRFPKKAAEKFITILKSLAANANEGNLDEPIIAEAMANQAARPYGRFGRTQKKRTHIKIIAKEKARKEKKK
jgi:ribosomal protein L22